MIILIVIIVLFLIFKFKQINFTPTIFNSIPEYKGEPIDAVYTWVDGNDPNWKTKKSLYTGAPKEDDVYRFQSINELKYSLRSLCKFAPWINKIYIVVDDDQAPSFVNEKSPKIKIIKHSDIIPKEYLPVFNSVAIEANIHHIEGLSENFLYFNDDTFLGDYIKPEDVFNICYHEPNVVYKDLVPQDEEWVCDLKNHYLYLKDSFKNARYIVPSHQVHFCKKSLMYDLENMFKEKHIHTSKQRLRKFDKTIVCQSFCLPKMQYNYGVYNGTYKLVPENSCIYLHPNASDSVNKVVADLDKIKYNKYKFFCINNSAAHSNLILNFLNDFYDFSCDYEK